MLGVAALGRGRRAPLAAAVKLNTSSSWRTAPQRARERRPALRHGPPPGRAAGLAAASSCPTPLRSRWFYALLRASRPGRREPAVVQRWTHGSSSCKAPCCGLRAGGEPATCSLSRSRARGRKDGGCRAARLVGERAAAALQPSCAEHARFERRQSTRSRRCTDRAGLWWRHAARTSTPRALRRRARAPPTETMRTSSRPMWSRISRSCASRRARRSGPSARRVPPPRAAAARTPLPRAGHNVFNQSRRAAFAIGHRKTDSAARRQWLSLNHDLIVDATSRPRSVRRARPRGAERPRPSPRRTHGANIPRWAASSSARHRESSVVDLTAARALPTRSASMPRSAPRLAGQRLRQRPRRQHLETSRLHRERPHLAQRAPRGRRLSTARRGPTGFVHRRERRADRRATRRRALVAWPSSRRRGNSSDAPQPRRDRAPSTADGDGEAARWTRCRTVSRTARRPRTKQPSPLRGLDEFRRARRGHLRRALVPARARAATGERRRPPNEGLFATLRAPRPSQPHRPLRPRASASTRASSIGHGARRDLLDGTPVLDIKPYVPF